MPQPVQKQFMVNLPNGESISNQTVSIPSGKTMRITHVSGVLFPPAKQSVRVSIQTAALQIDVPGGSTTGYHVFPTVSAGGGAVVFGQIANIPTMGGNIVLTIQRTGTAGNLTGHVTVAGELSP